ncbi:MAG: chromosome segregation protein SMC [Clostridia bacterium]|nr:chromosome segregation protein SMC [Clostridia bacterium]
MYLKSLELHGFKSFPNKTVLHFERGATVIVGPNGSGKSNISDAMRWVLGELSSRNIRGTRMEDVIFGGTDDRRPMGFAEVSVTFDNSDPEHRLDSEFDEVVVTRRYYRTGESEYLINRQPKRLRDIYELFMNTGVGREGYSIIGQGKIAEIISKKSDERRNIFEEAAGISKYRHRKEESERKLKHAQDNLDRVKDILFELENRVGPLEKEAEKARKGLALYEEKKRADVSLWLFDTKKIREDIDDADKALRLSKHDLEIIDQVIADLEIQNENLYEKAQQSKAASEQLLEKIRETTDRLHQLDNALRVAETNYSHSAELISGCRTRISEIESSKTALEASKQEYIEKRTKIEAEYQELMGARLEFLAEEQRLAREIGEARRQLEEALDELSVEEGNAAKLNIRINVLESSRESGGSKSQDIEREIEKYEADALVLKAEADRCEKAASGFKAKIAEKDQVINESNEKIASLGIERDKCVAALNDSKLRQASLIQRADVLQRMNDHFEGYAESVKFVMKEYQGGRLSSAGKIHGPLSSLIAIEKKYITAIETALGASLQNIVVDNENTAKAAISALKAANAGRATFYPISAIKSANETDEIRAAARLQGYVDRADRLVNSKDEYRSVIEWLLLRTLVFDNIDNAANAAKQLRYKVKIVTLDGQVINAGGAFTGGSAKRDSGILSRLNTISELKAEAEALDSDIKKAEKRLSTVEAEIADARQLLRDAEQEKELLLTLSRSQFAALDNANAKYDANNDIIEKLKGDLDSIAGQQSKEGEELISLRAEYEANLERVAALKDYRARRSLEMGVLDEKKDECSQQATELSIKAAETTGAIRSADEMIVSLDGRILELERDKDAQKTRILELQTQRDGIDELRSKNAEECAELEKELDNLRQKRTEVESGNDEFEREINNIRQRLKEMNSGRQVAYEAFLRNENKHQALLEKQDKLGSQLWDDYEITYEDAVGFGYPAVTAENRDEVAQVQVSCRNKLRALGGYNPGAIEEYAEVKARYDDLSTQYNDITKSAEELVEIIKRLEIEMRTSFIDAFEAINKNFGITFRELFGGGNAELSLTDPEDVLTSGIEIKAAPPGKIIKNLSLLSGGEQSFVAIALLFAILKVNPTPFCILDEIEAALDEVNVYRFGEYIKKFGDGTQFILITHRRGTMEIGNRLYGITMPQRGISQAIELNVSEIEGREKELLDGVL